MKKIKKVSMLLVVSMIFTLIAGGCTKQQSTAGDGESQGPVTESAAADKGIGEDGWTVGFTYMPPTDSLSAAFRKTLDYTAEQFGCKMVYGETTENTPDEKLNILQNHIQAGVDAYITINPSAAMIEQLDKNGIYFVDGGSTITDPDTLALAQASEFYCGSIMGDEVQAGYDLCRQVYDAGSRNIAYLALTAGLASSHDDRVRGIEKFAEEHSDLKIATSYRGIDYFTSSGPTDEILAAFPKIDGIISTGNVPTIPAAVYSVGKEKDIKYAAIDYQNGIDEWFQDGFLVGCEVGQYPVMQLCFTTLYEALSTGDILIANRNEPVNGSYLWISNFEEYEDYLKYVEGDVQAYTGDELKKMCGKFNTDATLEERQQMLVDTWNQYSLADVMSRHKDLL